MAMEKTKYVVVERGYHYPHGIPVHDSKKSARKEMLELAKESLQRAKRVWKDAAIVVYNDDSRGIHAGKDIQCPLWTSFSVVNY